MNKIVELFPVPRTQGPAQTQDPAIPTNLKIAMEALITESWA